MLAVRPIDGTSLQENLEEDMAFAHVNRKGRTYYLHHRQTRAGKDRYVFARTLGAGALDEVPEGYEVQENVNGGVSLAMIRPQLITDLEEHAVQSAMAKLPLRECRLEVRKNIASVFEPDRREADIQASLDGRSASSPAVARVLDWVAAGNFRPVVRFILDDKRTRTFHVERMTYRGDGGWSHPLGWGKIADLAKEFLPHVGKESFYDLF